MDAEKGVGRDLADLIYKSGSLLCSFYTVANISYLFIYYKHIFFYTLEQNSNSSFKILMC